MEATCLTKSQKLNNSMKKQNKEISKKIDPILKAILAYKPKPKTKKSVKKATKAKG